MTEQPTAQEISVSTVDTLPALPANQYYVFDSAGKHHIVTFKKPNVGQMNNVFKRTLVIKTDGSSPILNVEQYAYNMIPYSLSSLEQGFVPATPESVEAMEDYSIFQQFMVIISSNIEVSSFLQMVGAMFGAKPTKP